MGVGVWTVILLIGVMGGMGGSGFGGQDETLSGIGTLHKPWGGNWELGIAGMGKDQRGGSFA